MPEEVLFQSEGTQSRAEIASYLRRVAEKLDAGDDLTLTAGKQSVTMTPPDRSTFEVKAEREGPADSPGELSIEFEIEWNENSETDARGSTGELEIE
ncbi:amphi-Trp domain-containing protein [Halorubrum sp. AD140]|uniref:amphi-Trp domain-containing protein n=1 Tax=Halorubrum sp. AD140 TaxID=3050073 RepID=UPI002ACC8B04|nr:amphi-Trp domain-containing protein [Halorubrum sp. AD140]MDZ5811698.1 amphi-Trp domain-containing protein [Halorubrum sp. AD140]